MEQLERRLALRKKIFEVFHPFRWTMLGVLGFIALSELLTLTSPYLQGKVIDGLVSKKPLRELYSLAALTLLVYVGRGIIVMYCREIYELKNIDFKVSSHVNHLTLSRLFEFSIGQHISENSGLKQSVIGRGQHSLSTMAYTVLYQVVPLVAEVVLLIGLLMYFCWPLCVVVLAGSMLYCSVVIYTNLKFKKKFRKGEKLYNENGKFQGEVLRNVELVLSNAQEVRAVNDCDESLETVQSFWQKLWIKFAGYAAVRNLIVGFTRFTILVLGIGYVAEGRYTVGQLVMFLSWANQALGEISNIGSLHRQLIQLYTSIRKYFEMLAVEPDVKVMPNPVRPNKFNGRIEFKNVTFRYKRREVAKEDEGEEIEDEEDSADQSKEVGPALENVNFEIEPGQTVAFVGESGAGKSTLVHALIRAQDPEAGQILVDGHDIRLLDLKKFRESVGIVDQQVFLFDHTLRYNITYGLNGKGRYVTNEELHQVGRMSCVSKFYDRLEKGFDTIIGEKGVKLSGGERQRVGIARALIKQPDILVFDEATSNLDSENESLIQEAIGKASSGRTTIIIAHRFSTIRNVGKVVVLDKGKVVGQGTHKELYGSCDVYRRLAEKQNFVPAE